MFTYKHPHPAVTADCILLAPDQEQRPCVLLIERKNNPCKGQWAFPGGFMNIDETAEQAAVRELQEETGICLDKALLSQVGAYSAVDRDPRERVITIAYLATIPAIIPATGADDAACAQWFRLDKLPQLAFDHAQILEDALRQWNSEQK